MFYKKPIKNNKMVCPQVLIGPASRLRAADYEELLRGSAVAMLDFMLELSDEIDLVPAALDDKLKMN